jgi:hypothetical protein
MALKQMAVAEAHAFLADITSLLFRVFRLRSIASTPPPRKNSRVWCCHSLTPKFVEATTAQQCAASFATRNTELKTKDTNPFASSWMSCQIPVMADRPLVIAAALGSEG